MSPVYGILVKYHWEPKRREIVRHEHHDLRNQAILDSKNIHRQSPPVGIAGLASITRDCWLQVGMGQNAAEATKSFGAVSPVVKKLERLEIV